MLRTVSSTYFLGRPHAVLLLCLAALAGCDGSDQSASTDSAAQSKITAGSWRALPAVEGEHYQDLSAVRVGRAVVVVSAATGTQSRLKLLVFDTRSRRWRTTTSPMRWRVDPSAALANGELIVWGGCCGPAVEGNTADGMRYDPIEDKWRQLAGSPLGRRAAHSAAWTGEEMIVWGGVPPGDTIGNQRAMADGAAYDPDRAAWRELAEAPLEGRSNHAAVWTGEEMIVWGGVPSGGGSDNQLVLSNGAAYDPEGDSWRRIPDAPIRSREGSQGAQAVWTGEEMLVWNSEDGAAYDPELDAWRRLPDPGRGLAENDTIVWSGEEMLVWGGGGHRGRADGLAYDPARNEWKRIPEAPLTGRDRHAAVWTGSAMLVWGGCCRGDRYYTDGALYSRARAE